MTTDDLADTPATDPGDAFEEQCLGLLRRRYPPSELVILPAQMGGDCGIEAFSTDGIAYQCYADRESASLRHRTDKQKNKLYADTEKLKKNVKRLPGVLGDTAIRHYFLLVPEYHAVELVEYAHKRSEVVRQYNLPFIDEQFAIRIKTPHDYPTEFAAALRDDSAKALVPDPEIKDSNVDSFDKSKPELVERLDQKLAVLQQHSPTSDVAVLRNQFIRAFLAKEQVMDGLREWPDTWEAVEARRTHRQNTLELENELDPAAPSQRLLDLIRSYGEELGSQVAGIRLLDAQRISMGQAGDWLMRCPLRFRAFE
ncbi:hypothetical protein SAMN05216266_107299 [Amycolatopsis marina]|uniref:Uncharacterized protein n=1 Tax=Amycolatopsis marina TaxID=490629 RepID=A0A1I0ZXQ5_9PSEU|nr:hypothetical protein [Amycolatopsis marina]SFB29210.1 hypothetical protein SAMN05216266_107299 [Amycolatopsis marina]